MKSIYIVLLTNLIAAGSGTDAATPGKALDSTAAAHPTAGAATVAAAGRADGTPAAAAEPATATREITIPAGTQLNVALDAGVGSDTSRVEQPVTAHLTRPVHVQGQTVLAEGTRVAGVVTDATRSGKVKGRAHVAIRFNSVTPRGGDERYPISAASIGRTAPATKQRDALEIGAPAAGGAIIGALVGGKKGALVGTAVGGGAGTAVVLSTRGKEVHLAKGTPLMLKLSAPLTVRVKS
jgi:hypothetical protein